MTDSKGHIMLKKTTLAIGLLAAIALPATAIAQPPSKADKRNAARECRAERETMGVEAFREQYGSNRNNRNAFGKCVSAKARAQEDDSAA